MKIDLNYLKALISKSKPNQRLITFIDPVERTSLQLCQKEIEKFTQRGENYIVVVLKN
jgi:hypothetical protein